jgi:hypothetical protein
MFLVLHAGFMITGLVLMTAGIAVARFMRGKTWWLRSHRALEICAVLSLALGFMVAVTMVAESGEEHFDVLHAWVGAAVILGAAGTSILGQLQFVLKGRRAEIRKAHRRAGAVVLVLLCLNILSGLVLAGVIPDMRSF